MTRTRQKQDAQRLCGALECVVAVLGSDTRRDEEAEPLEGEARLALPRSWNFF